MNLFTRIGDVVARTNTLAVVSYTAVENKATLNVTAALPASTPHYSAVAGMNPAELRPAYEQVLADLGVEAGAQKVVQNGWIHLDAWGDVYAKAEYISSIRLFKEHPVPGTDVWMLRYWMALPAASFPVTVEANPLKDATWDVAVESLEKAQIRLTEALTTISMA